ncbi:MAG TPA: hypothetical protein VL156_11110 [Terriglobales bacterium]|jgi:high-affinity nickel permease|nr:hypothetical protein [Terriglobales bacterium]
MNCERCLIAAAVFLVTGLGLIFGFTHGTLGFGAAYPVAGTALEVSLKTTGLPALAGLISTLVGVLLLIIALVQALVAQVPSEPAKAPTTKVA